MLAEAMPQVSEDNLMYTIKIKKGVYFQDNKCFPDGKGRELKAADFIYAWKRIANIKYVSKNWWMFDDKIVGLDEFRAYTKTCKTLEDVDLLRDVEGFQAPDDYTIVIKLKRPWPQIIYILTHLPAAPVAKEAVNRYGEDIVSSPVGTGPFKLKVWNRGSYIELVRNVNFRPDYYPSEGQPEDRENGLLVDAGKRVPFIDKISYMIIEEEQPRWLQFLRGKMDTSIIAKDNYNQTIDVSRGLTDEMKERGIHLKKFKDPDTFWLGFNMEDPVLGKNKPLRRALSYAVDRNKHNDIFWNGRYDIAYGFIPPIMKSFNPRIKEIGDSFNPQAIPALIKEAEKIHGGKIPTLKLTMGGTHTLSRQMGQFYSRDFKDAGFDVEIEYMDWPTFQAKLNSKSTQIFSIGWIADYPDAETFLQLFYSKNISPGSNNFNFVNSKYDELYNEAAVLPDSPERTKLYRQAEQFIIEQCPAIFTEHRVRYILHHDWLENYKPHVFLYAAPKYYRIDVAKRSTY